jgi:hypothetical protein
MKLLEAELIRKFQNMKAHLLKEGVGNVPGSMPKLEKLRFEANKVF